MHFPQLTDNWATSLSYGNWTFSPLNRQHSADTESLYSNQTLGLTERRKLRKRLKMADGEKEEATNLVSKQRIL